MCRWRWCWRTEGRECVRRCNWLNEEYESGDVRDKRRWGSRSSHKVCVLEPTDQFASFPAACCAMSRTPTCGRRSRRKLSRRDFSLTSCVWLCRYEEEQLSTWVFALTLHCLNHISAECCVTRKVNVMNKQMGRISNLFLPSVCPCLPQCFSFSWLFQFTTVCLWSVI